MRAMGPFVSLGVIASWPRRRVWTGRPRAVRGSAGKERICAPVFTITRGNAMYIGVGTVILIILVVLLILFLRRRV
jgi:low affinity Fe/Cu permease